MRLVKFGLGLLMLRRLPFRFFTRWMLRFAVWGGLGYALVRKLKPELLSQPRQALRSYEPSAWTAPPPSVPDAETEAVSRVFTDALVDEATTIVVDEIDFDAETGTITETILVEEIAGDEMVDVIVSASIALDQVAETPADIGPQWIRGDGTMDCPPDFPLKAKASSLIYHNHESRNYDQTVPDVCFASEQSAQAAGYRAPLR